MQWTKHAGGYLNIFDVYLAMLCRANDDINVAWVKNAVYGRRYEDKDAIKILREEKQYSSRRLLNEFLNKK